MKNPPFCIFSIRILNRETFIFLGLIIFSILDDTDLLMAFPFEIKDGTESGLSIYFRLLPRKRRFRSWLSPNESSLKWSERTWIALDKTGLANALIQTFLVSFPSWTGILSYETFLLNLEWFEHLLHIKWSFLFHRKFPLLSYNLNTVSLNDKDAKSSRRIRS